jgi:hypothetical protein
MKRRFDLLPFRALRAVAFIQAIGAEKHQPNTWQALPMEKHLDAALSHLSYWAAGEKIDETGQSHLWNAATRILFLVEQEIIQQETAVEPQPEIMEPVQD